MKGKRFSRLVEWGKTLLILLLAASAIYLVGQTQFSDGMLESVRELLSSAASNGEEGFTEHKNSTVIRPMRLAMTLEGGQRYGVQYNLTESGSAFSSVSTLLAEALSSASAPRKIGEWTWRSDLSEVGIYLDLHYPLPLAVLSGQLDNGQRSAGSSAVVRRICLAAGQNDSVNLLYIDESDGAFYSCATTLSRQSHLDPVLTGRSANGALFAFEVPGMEHVAPYVLLTTTPQPVKYSSGNPLAGDTARMEELLDTLSFQSRGSELDPVAGGLLVEGNDSLRLMEDGTLTFHTIGDADFRLLLPENTDQGALDYTRDLADDTVGKWCEGATLYLSGVQETADGLEIHYRYCLNGIPVELPEGNPAARFTVRNGAVTDFFLYFRSYSVTDETTLILPELQAAAVLGTSTVEGKELTLVYRDSGGDMVGAGWIAN